MLSGWWLHATIAVAPRDRDVLFWIALLDCRGTMHHRCRVSRKEGPFSRELPTRHEIKQGHTPRSYRFDAIAAWHCTARQHSTTQPQFIEVTHRTAHFLRARSREACRLATLAALLQQEAACRHKKGTSRIIGSNHLQHMAL